MVGGGKRPRLRWVEVEGVVGGGKRRRLRWVGAGWFRSDYGRQIQH